MADDTAELTVRLVEQITGPAGEATKAVVKIIKSAEDLDKALGDIDAAMAHQDWVTLKKGQAEAEKLEANARKLGLEFQRLDAAMAHQDWVTLKRGQAEANKFQATAKKLEAEFEKLDAAMAHQDWVSLKKGQAETAKLEANAKKLEAEFQKLDDAMAHQNWVALKRGEEAMLRVEKAGKIAGVSLDSLATGVAAGFAAVAAVVAAAAAAAALATFEIGKASVEAGIFAESSTRAISQLSGGIGNAEKSFDDVREMAQKLGLEVHETEHAFQHFLAMQFTPEDAKDLIKMGADLQSIGTSADGVQRVYHQLAMIKSLGKLQFGQLTDLAQAGVSEKLVMEALEHNLQKTPEQIQKALKDGSIKAEEGIQAIKDAIIHKTHESELGEAGEAFANTTLQGMQNKLHAGLDNALIDIGKAILPQLQTIGTEVGAMFGRLADSDKLERVKNGFVLVFSKIAQFIERSMPTIEKVVSGAIDVIIFGLNATASVIDFVTGHWDTITTVLKGVAIVVGIVGGVLLAAGAIFMGTILAGVAAVTALAVGIGIAIGYVVDFWKSVGPPIYEAIASVVSGTVSAIGAVLSFFSGGEAFFAAVQWAKSMVDGLIQGISDFAGAALEKVTGLGTSIGDAFKSALGIASPSKVFEEAGMFAVEGFTLGIASNDNQVRGATADLAASATAGLETGQAAGASGGLGGIGDINVTVSGVTDPAVAQEIGRTIGVEVRREITAFFEKAQAA